MQLRQQAAERFSTLPIPTTKSELYRFTSLDDIDLSQLPGDGANAGKVQIPDALLGEAEEESLVALVDGIYSEPLINIELSSKSVKWGALSESAKSLGDILVDDRFAQFAEANWKEGFSLSVPKDTKLTLPLRLLQYFSKGGMVARVRIHLSEGAELTYVEEFADDATAGAIYVGLHEYVLDAGAKLHYSQVQNFGTQTKYFIRQQFSVAKGAELKMNMVHVGGKKGQTRQDIICTGPGAKVEVTGSARGAVDQHFDFLQTLSHCVPNTESTSNFYFVMDGHSRAVFNGTVKIDGKGIGTNASQKVRTLLLSSKATVHALPKLEIATDQVKCAHGASVSTVNDEQIHYLRCRGISLAEATRMIVHGFTSPAVTHIPGAALRKRVNALLTQKEWREDLLQ